MSDAPMPRTLVVNFNSPELNQLALALASCEGLQAYVRPYVNKGRGWERALSALPMAGRAYSRTFGRRLMSDPRLAALTHEAGVWPDLCAASIGRLHLLPPHTRHRWTNRLVMSVREAVAQSACKHVQDADCIVGYEGFALPAFEAARSLGGRSAVLNYPVAHHRQRRRVRLEENEREPEFAVTWPGFNDWPEGHEERLDEEIRLADAVLVGSGYVADSFVAEGIERSKMRVVPYGVDLRTFTPASPTDKRPSDRFNVIYAGQLTQRKGIAYLLRGYRQFARADSQLTLVGSIVGSDAPLQPFADLFEHIPHQTRPALAERYRQSDVFVLPTLIEGMPLVVLEAMACGLPVIVTANGPGDIVRDGIDGFVIPERDADAVCDRLERLYRDPEMRREMGQQAAQRAREFGWEAYAAKARRVLADLGGATEVCNSRFVGV
jgi:glycosyltransferase involved in cell wall biosynthesis